MSRRNEDGSFEEIDGDVRPVSDVIEELAAGLVVTLDPGRSCVAPCVGCGAEGPHDLVTIGRRTDEQTQRAMGVSVQRPVCERCKADVEWGKS